MLAETFLPVDVCAGNEFRVYQEQCPIMPLGNDIKRIKLINKDDCAIDEDMLNKLAEEHKGNLAFLVNENGEALAEQVTLYHISGYPAYESVPVLAPILIYKDRPLLSSNWTVYAKSEFGARAGVNYGPVIKVWYDNPPEMPAPGWEFRYIWIRADYDQYEWVEAGLRYR